MNNVERIIITCTLTVFALSTFFANSTSLAECKAGKFEVVVTTPSGKTKTICVSENALPGILNAAEHSAATFDDFCPCFTLGQIEGIDGYRDDNGSPIPYECYLWEAQDPFEQDWARIGEDDHGPGEPNTWMQYAIADGEQMMCIYYLKIDGDLIEQNISYGLTPGEVDACYAIIEQVCDEN